MSQKRQIGDDDDDDDKEEEDDDDDGMEIRMGSGRFVTESGEPPDEKDSETSGDTERSVVSAQENMWMLYTEKVESTTEAPAPAPEENSVDGRVTWALLLCCSVDPARELG